MIEYQTRALFELTENTQEPRDPFMPSPSSDPDGWHKWVFFAATLATLAFIGSGCVPKNMIARKDCDDKMRLVVEAMRARTDTFVVYRTDTIITREFRSDTVLKMDTLIHTIEKEKLRVQWQVIRDTMHIQAQCRTDTIYRTVKETTIKQGATDGLAPETESTHFKSYWWLWVIGGVAMGWFAFFWRRRKNNKDE